MNSFLENRPMVARQEGVVIVPKPEPTFQPLFPAGSPAEDRAEQAAKGPAEAGPQIELIQNRGKVERIIVTCTCCKRIELQCEY
jgi:hypothetical protein